MDYLKQFQKNFWDNEISVRDCYSSVKSNPKPDVPEGDVVSDLVSFPVSSACLPIAKQIVMLDSKITIKLPQVGDLFIGLLHQPIIKSVSFTIHNHNDECTIEGILKPFSSGKMWVFTQLPIPLICLGDYEKMYVETNICLNQTYNIQTFNQDVFKAYYGYFQKAIQCQVINQAVYEIPLYDDIHDLKIICGLWTIEKINEINEIEHVK